MKKMITAGASHFALSAMALLAAGSAGATDLSDDGSLKLSGFYNITGARVLSGQSLGNTSWDYLRYKCPCSVQNWEYTAVYERSEGWQFNQESLVGVQIKKEFSPTLSATVQLVMRANNPNRGNRPTVDWAYATWQPSADSAWTLQAGQFRIPLYYYSDYLYVGYAYPWVRAVPDVYGWPIYAYQGGNVSYRTQLGQTDWAATFHVWGGGYTQRNDAYDTRLYYDAPTNESWKKMVGGYVSANNGVFDVRAMMMWYKDTTWQDAPGGGRVTLVDNQGTRIGGLSVNMDYKNWLVKSELDRYEQVDQGKGINNVYKYALVGVGYQWDEWTPMYTFSRYTTVTDPIEARNTQYLSLRWDFRKNTALKVQYDVSKDKSHYPYPFFGDSRMVSVSLQGIF